MNSSVYTPLHVFYQSAACEVCSLLVLRLLYIFHICLFVGLCIPTYHVRRNYVMYCNFTLAKLLWVLM